MTRGETEKSSSPHSKAYSNENMLDFIYFVPYKSKSFSPSDLAVLITSPSAQ